MMIKALPTDSRLHRFLQVISWPALMIICIGMTAYGFEVGAPMLYFNFAYLFLFVALFVLEALLPFEKEWQKPDGQNFACIMHTLSSKGTVQLLLLFGGTIGLLEILKPISEPVSYGLWPRSWPLVLQVILGVYVAEFMLYWAHRWSHLVPFFWRFHAVHHSVVKLWVINTGRFHFLDSFWKIIMGMGILLALGAPLEIIQWISAITAFFGVLTHCNVDMKAGPLSYVFNTPELHRWHHSKKLSEGNRNYCENVILWDQVFGTYINPRDRRPPANIGITDYMPPKFWQQIAWPFLTNSMKKKIYPDFKPKAFATEKNLARVKAQTQTQTSA